MSQIQTQKIIYSASGAPLEGILVYNGQSTAPRPGVVIAPNWMGVTDSAVQLVSKVAEQGYVVLIADLYGAGKRPSSADEAGPLMMEVKNQPAEVERMQQAVVALTEQKFASVDGNNVAAAGFCFGGHCVLELARSGAALRAAISFHGGLDTCGRYDAAKITGPVLVLDGAADPMVPREQLSAFVTEMSAAKVDWQLISYHDAVHSFTDVEANRPGVAQYHPQVAERAFDSMFELLKRVM